MKGSILMPIQENMEHTVNTDDDFKMTVLANMTWPEIEGLASISGIVPHLRQVLGANNYRKLSYSILRNAFLIELVKVPKIETTKFRLRWFNQLDGDPRYCSFDECMSIAEHLLTTLPTWLQTPAQSECMQLSFSDGLVPYEAPLDYLQRFTPQGRLHQLGNLVWIFDESVLRTLRLRRYLTDKTTSPDYKFFRTLLRKKISVKTYLTDRVQTGDHKTDREKRWETHPDSVHFAERRVCMAIEYTLVTKVCGFEGFPPAWVTQLQQANVLPQPLPTALCPITGDRLSYEAFQAELSNPTHGESGFQIGHLNPLKLGEDGEPAGHTVDNIGWISADGNRIQGGKLGINDVRKLIQRISQNYSQYGWWPQPSN